MKRKPRTKRPHVRSRSATQDAATEFSREMRRLNKLQWDNALDQLIWNQNHGDDPTGKRFGQHIRGIELHDHDLDTPEGVRLARTVVALGHRLPDRTMELLRDLTELSETLDEIRWRAGTAERYAPHRYVAVVESATGPTWVETYSTSREGAAHRLRSAHGEQALICTPFRDS